MRESTRPRQIGIVFALQREARGLEKVLAESHTLAYKVKGQFSWSVGHANVMITVSGVGREQCARATENLLEAGAQWIICAGYAAALDPEARVGDVCVANRVLLNNRTSAPPLECSRELMSAVPPSQAFGFRTRWCEIATGDFVVCTPQEKTEAYRATGAAVLDMESYAAAEVCARRGVPFAAVRSISDTADQELPAAIRRLSELDSSFKQAFFSLARPALWPSLARLSANAKVAAMNLGDVLGLMLLRLV